MTTIRTCTPALTLALTAFGGALPASTAPSTAVHVRALAEDPIEVSFEKLKAAKYEAGKPLEDWVSDLDGKQIQIEGYMAVGTFEGVKTFELVPESCECGRSKVNHFVEVTIKEGVTSYRPGRLELVGKFSASEVKEDGFVKSVYRLEIESLD